MDREISPPPLKRPRMSNACPSEPPQTQSDLRIFAWNINGIGSFVQQSITSFFKSEQSAAITPPSSLRDFLRRHDWPTFLLLQEVKIAPSDTATQKAVRAAVSRRPGSSDPHYEVFFTLPTDKYNATGFGRKVYGVCTLVRSDFLAEQQVTYRTVTWDAEGRIGIIETAGLHGWPMLSIWNVYAVNGTEFDYRDSITGEVVGTRHDRKLEVHRLMVRECQDLEAKGFQLILAGDMNVARDRRDGHPRLRERPEQHVRNRRDFVEKMFDGPGGLQAIDTFRELHGDARRYTWFSRNFPFGESCDRVDYVICSGGLGESLKEAGMLDTEQERGTSDHCPVFAGFSFKSREGSDDKDDKTNGK